MLPNESSDKTASDKTRLKNLDSTERGQKIFFLKETKKFSEIFRLKVALILE